MSQHFNIQQSHSTTIPFVPPPHQEYLTGPPQMPADILPAAPSLSPSSPRFPLLMLLWVYSNWETLGSTRELEAIFLISETEV